MTKHKFMFLLLALTASFTYGSAQTVEVVKLEALQKHLKSTSDTTYVINFWATWCKPCVEELPAFEKLNKETSSNKIKVILVSLDFKSKLEERVLPFCKKQQLSSTLWLLDEPDYNAWIDKVSPSWSGSIPATIIVNGARGYRKFYEQSFTFEQLQEATEKASK